MNIHFNKPRDQYYTVCWTCITMAVKDNADYSDKTVGQSLPIINRVSREQNALSLTSMYAIC